MLAQPQAKKIQQTQPRQQRVKRAAAKIGAACRRIEHLLSNIVDKWRHRLRPILLTTFLACGVAAAASQLVPAAGLLLVYGAASAMTIALTWVCENGAGLIGVIAGAVIGGIPIWQAVDEHHVTQQVTQELQIFEQFGHTDPHLVVDEA